MATIKVRMLGDSASLERSFKRAAGSATGFNRTMGRTSRGILAGSGVMRGLGRTVAFTSAGFLGGAGLGAAFASTITKAADFQQSLNVLQSVSGATAKQMKAAAAQAQKLGGDITLPATSAKDAAAAMTELAKGGLSVRDSMAAAKGTLQLAAAGQLDGATAAQIQANALNQFGLAGDKASTVADVLSNAANAASGEITDMATALSYVGPVAAGVGESIGHTGTAIALLAKNGILGDKAGTALRAMIASLAHPSRLAKKGLEELGVKAFDSKGKFVGFRSVIEQLSKAQGSLTQKQFTSAAAMVFGREPLAAIIALAREGAPGFDKMGKAVEKTGGAARVAAARNKGFKGALDGLKSAIETVQIQLGSALLPTLTRYVKAASTWLSQTKNQQSIMQTFKSVIASVASVLRVLRSVFVGLNTVTGGTKNTLKLLLGVFVAFKVAKLVGTFTGVARSVGLITPRAKEAATAIKKIPNVDMRTPALAKIGKLQGALRGLAAIGVITIGIELLVHRKAVDTAVTGFLDKHGAGFLTGDQIGGSKSDVAAWAAAHIGDKGFTGDAARAAAKKLQLGVDPAKNPFALGPIRPATLGQRSPDDKLFGRASGAAAVIAKVADPIKRVLGKSAAELRDQRNNWFDALIGRETNRVQDISGETGQIAALGKIGAQITARIATTKDVTRKLKLEDDLLDVIRQQKQLREQKAAADKQKKADAVAAILDSLQFGVDKAQATKGLGDDLKALAAQKQGIAKQLASDKGNLDLQRQLLQVNEAIKGVHEQQKQARADAAAKTLDRLQFGVDKAAITKSLADDLTALTRQKAGLQQQLAADKGNLDLQRQLFGVNQQIADTKKQQQANRQAARSARGFRALGLTAEGEEITPSVQNLRKRLGTISEAVRGTFLDTGKTRTRFAQIKNALTDALAPKDVRAKVKDLLDGIASDLKAHENGPLTKLHAVSTKALTEGLDLTGAQRRVLRQRIAGAHLLNKLTPEGAGAGAKVGPGHVVVHNTVTLDGHVIGRSVTQHQTKIARRKPTQTRGQQTR